MKMVSDVAKSGIHRILAGASTIKITSNNNAWPVMTQTIEFVSQNTAAKAFATLEAKAVLSNFRDRMITLNGMVCVACRGWGHISTDGLGKGKRFCIVNELVDQAYADATNKKLFNGVIGKQPVKRKVLGLVLADDFGNKGTLKRQKRDNVVDEAMDGVEEED